MACDNVMLQKQQERREKDTSIEMTKLRRLYVCSTVKIINEWVPGKVEIKKKFVGKISKSNYISGIYPVSQKN